MGREPLREQNRLLLDEISQLKAAADAMRHAHHLRINAFVQERDAAVRRYQLLLDQVRQSASMLERELLCKRLEKLMGSYDHSRVTIGFDLSDRGWVVMGILESENNQYGRPKAITAEGDSMYDALDQAISAAQ